MPLTCKGFRPERQRTKTGVEPADQGSHGKLMYVVDAGVRGVKEEIAECRRCVSSVERLCVLRATAVSQKLMV